MIPRILGTSRYLILIAVCGSFLSATTLIIYGGLNVVFIALETLRKGKPTPDGAKELIVNSIESIDLFLLCVVLYIIAAGLYKLFVGPIDIPEWLEVNSLDGLKSQLVNVIIVLFGVIFLGQVVTWHGGLDILFLGLGIAAVIFSLVYTMKHGHKSHDSSANDSKNQGKNEDADHPSP